MITGATISCLKITETEDAFAACHVEAESGATGTVISDEDGKSP
jgi:hypothetical protein